MSEDMLSTKGMVNPYVSIDYSKVGKTASGRAWVEKALHPPGGAVGPLLGMPDNESYPSTVMEFRPNAVIPPPTGQTVGTWNCLILLVPNPEFPYLYWTWDPSSSGGPSMGTSTVAATPPINASSTPNPNLTWQTWDRDVARWRLLYESATVEYNAPALSDQGMVYCAQQRLEQMESTAWLPTQPATVEDMPTRKQSTFLMDSLPVAQSTLAQLSPNYYRQKAKQGCFTTLGLAQPVNKYQVGTSSTNRFMTNGQFNSIAASTQFGFDVGNRTQTGPGTDTISRITAGFSDNWTSSWMLFTGLSLQGTLEIKTIVGVEAQPSLGSSFALFVRESALPDSAAIDAYYTLRHGMLDAYPASYNLFGSLFAGLGSLVPRIASWLAPVAKAAAPAAGQVLTSLLAGDQAPSSAVAAAATPRPILKAQREAGAADAVLRKLEQRLANLEIRRDVVAPRRAVSTPAPRRGRSRSRRKRVVAQ